MRVIGLFPKEYAYNLCFIPYVLFKYIDSTLEPLCIYRVNTGFFFFPQWWIQNPKAYNSESAFNSFFVKLTGP